MSQPLLPSKHLSTMKPLCEICHKELYRKYQIENVQGHCLQAFQDQFALLDDVRKEYLQIVLETKRLRELENYFYIHGWKYHFKKRGFKIELSSTHMGVSPKAEHKPSSKGLFVD